MLFNNPINRKVLEIPLVQIRPRKNPIRRIYSRDKLVELAGSIEKNGILQPLTVRKADNMEFELISGERRLRAAAMCGYVTVPCMIVSCTDEQANVFSLTENLQRSNMNFFEEAEIINNIISHFNISKQELALQIGQRPSFISDKLEILDIGYEERNIILKSHLTERHAKAILKITDKVERRIVLSEIIENNMNVSQSEEYINEILKNSKLQRHKNQQQKAVIKDIRIFENTINHAVDTMRDSGIPAIKIQTENEDFIEYVVKIPKLINGHNDGLTA